MKLQHQLILSLFLLLTCCKAQVKPISEGALQLKSLDFGTNIKELYPDKYKSKNFDDYYEFPSSVSTVMFKKETVYDEQYGEVKKPMWIEYREQGSSSGDTFAAFDKFPFNTVNVVTTLNGELMVVNGVINEVSKNDSQNFIKSLDGLYGKHTMKKDTSGRNVFDNYTWKLDDRTIKYCIVYDDESNTLKIEVDKENKTIKNVAKEPHYQGLIFILNKEYEQAVVGHMTTGDLTYLH